MVGHAKNGAEALRLYKELAPDVVCMDIIMPVLDGLQATRTILEHDPDAKIVVISSQGGNAEKAAEALRVGARAVITKPFKTEQLVSTLRQV